VTDKQEIAQILEEMGSLLELKGENPFRIRAYQNGARALLNLDEELSKVIEEDRLTDVEGIGDHLAKSITTLAKTGRLPEYEKLKKSIPPILLEMIELQGLGPKTAKALYQKLKIKSISDLKKAATEGKIAKLKGFGAKTEKNILKAIEDQKTHQNQYLWFDAMEIAAPILKELKELKGVKQAEICGSLRRKMEIVGDLDFLVGSDEPKPIMDWFTSKKRGASIIAKGATKGSIRLHSGIQADLRIVPTDQFLYALIYFTGSKEHNIALRSLSLKKGFSLSEYGFEAKDKKSVMPKMKDEKGFYRSLSLSYIPPELRENLGEIEAAAKGKIPKLIEEGDIRGSFHNHTAESDGRNSLQQMIHEAERLKWEYLGISDHSKSSVQAGGLSEEKLLEQVEIIKKINRAKQFKTHVFTGTECDILPNGSLDYSDEILKQLDFVIVSIHSSLRQDEKTITKRIIKALEHRLTTMLAHLTSRLLLQRPPSLANINKIIDAAIANKKIVEINGSPMRLDMDWRYWRKAAEKGLLCSINPDAHSVEQLQFVNTGVNIARKGWLTKADVINTLPLKEVSKFLN